MTGASQLSLDSLACTTLHCDVWNTTGPERNGLGVVLPGLSKFYHSVCRDACLPQFSMFKKKGGGESWLYYNLERWAQYLAFRLTVSHMQFLCNPDQLDAVFGLEILVSFKNTATKGENFGSQHRRNIARNPIYAFWRQKYHCQGTAELQNKRQKSNKKTSVAVDKLDSKAVLKMQACAWLPPVEFGAQTWRHFVHDDVKWRKLSYAVSYLRKMTMTTLFQVAGSRSECFREISIGSNWMTDLLYTLFLPWKDSVGKQTDKSPCPCIRTLEKP